MKTISKIGFVLMLSLMPLVHAESATSATDAASPTEKSHANPASREIIKALHVEEAKYKANSKILLKHLTEAKTADERAKATEALKAEITRHKAVIVKWREALAANHNAKATKGD